MKSNETEKTFGSSDDKKKTPSKPWQRYLPSTYRDHKTITRISAVFFSIILLVFAIQPPLNSLFSRQKSNLLQDHSIMLRETNQLPSPEGIVTGQQNADARAIVQITDDAVSTIETKQADISLGRSLPLASWFTARVSAGEVRTLRQEIDSTEQVLTSSLTPYQQSLEALLLFFEYSPRVDTLEYSAGSSDSVERMDRLSSGLEETKASLESIDHELAAGLIEIIASAQRVQADLESSGDVGTFVDEFSALQNQAKDKAIEWHTTTQSDLRTHLNRLIQKIQRTL